MNYPSCFKLFIVLQTLVIALRKEAEKFRDAADGSNGLGLTEGSHVRLQDAEIHNGSFVQPAGYPAQYATQYGTQTGYGAGYVDASYANVYVYGGDYDYNGGGGGGGGGKGGGGGGGKAGGKAGGDKSRISKSGRRGGGRGSKKHGSRKQCESPKNLNYLQRSQFIIYARQWMKGYNGVVMPAVDNLITDPNIISTVPTSQKMMGWNPQAKQCMGQYNGGNGPVCAIVDHKLKEMQQWKYDWYLVSGSNGRLCRQDKQSGVRRMSLSQITAIVAYSADEGDGKAFYNVLNKDLSQVPTLGKDYVLAKWSVFLYWFLGAANCLDPTKNPSVLYRGMNIGSFSKVQFGAEYYEGRFVVWTGITSATPLMQLAIDQYAKPPRPESAVVFEIKPTLAYNLEAFSKYAYEKEFVLPPMSLFKVISRSDFEGMLWIQLQQLDKKLMEDHCIREDTYVY